MRKVSCEVQTLFKKIIKKKKGTEKKKEGGQGKMEQGGGCRGRANKEMNGISD